MREAPPTLPWSSLEAAASARFGRPRHTGEDDCRCKRGGDCWSPTDLAAVLDVKRNTVVGWMRRGTIPMERGDELAVALGTLPQLVWSEWVEWMDARVAAIAADDEAIADATMIARASVAVRRAEQERRRYWANPQRRAARIVQRRQTYAANPEPVKARQRVYDRTHYDPAARRAKYERTGR